MLQRRRRVAYRDTPSESTGDESALSQTFQHLDVLCNCANRDQDAAAGGTTLLLDSVFAPFVRSGPSVYGRGVVRRLLDADRMDTLRHTTATHQIRP